eukprot:evm.model.scf_1055.2 EVM.evm.TU.scf_1055.2   scf_1055:9334-14045(+)
MAEPSHAFSRRLDTGAPHRCPRTSLSTLPRHAHPGHHPSTQRDRSAQIGQRPRAGSGGGALGRVAERPAFSGSEMVRFGDFEVSPMGIGTWAWGNKLLWDYDEGMDPELQGVFNLAVTKGVNLFDTADSYGTGQLNGRSEILLGRFIREYPGSEAARQNIHVATKFAAYPWRVLPSNIVAACQGSLRRLAMDKLSVGQLHWSAAKYAPLQEVALWNGLADCYQKKMVRAVGVSNYGPKELQRIVKKLGKRDVPLASAQIQFSLLSCGKQQMELKSACDDLGIAVISYSPLALGLLSGKYSEGQLPKGPRGILFGRLLPEIRPLLRVLQEVADTRSKTVPQVAINWCMCKGTIPIPGAKDMQQAEDNLGALGWRLSDGEVTELDSVARGLKRTMIQNIFQTS